MVGANHIWPTLGLAMQRTGLFPCFQSEYIAEHDKRREFITGFTGSAGSSSVHVDFYRTYYTTFIHTYIGLAVVTEKQALLWTDGRYHLQASKELDLAVWTLMPQGRNTLL